MTCLRSTPECGGDTNPSLLWVEPSALLSHVVVVTGLEEGCHHWLKGRVRLRVCICLQEWGCMF